MNYDDLKATIANLTNYTQNVEQGTAANFEQIFPNAIEAAELMMFRDPDLDFLAFSDADTVTCTPNSRNLLAPADMVIIEEVNVITPASATDPDDGTRVPLTRVALAFLNYVARTASDTDVPVYFAVQSEIADVQQVRLAPTPDDDYTVEFIGMFRPETLSAGNPNTFISDNLPDLLTSAVMIYMSGFQRDFGAQSEDPKMALSWSALYAEQKKGAAVQSARQQALSAGNTAYPPSTVASPARSS